MTKHLRETAARADGRNSLWRVFGLTQRGAPATVDDPVNAKLDLLVTEVEKLRASSTPPTLPDRLSLVGIDDPSGLTDFLSADAELALLRAGRIASETRATLTIEGASGNFAMLSVRGLLPAEQRERIRRVADQVGVTLQLADAPPPR